MRLNKFIAHSGHSSRRQADILISRGKVFLNGKIVKKLGTKIDPDKDAVFINNVRIIYKTKKYYYKLYKPRGYISTTKDKFAQKIVTDLIQKNQKLFLVGRLDKNSEGLILLTNDGELAYLLTHPKNMHKKVYVVEILYAKNISKSHLSKTISELKKGIKLDNADVQFDKVKVLKINKDKAILKITLHQGIKRQIRRMFKKYDYEVISLKRTQISKIKLGTLKPGEYEEITRNQIV